MSISFNRDNEEKPNTNFSIKRESHRHSGELIRTKEFSLESANNHSKHVSSTRRDQIIS